MSNKLSPVQEVKHNLIRMQPEFEKALPPHISAAKFVRTIQTAISTTPALMKADRSSLWAACTQASQAGLMPDGREAALVPFGNKVQFMPMVSGLLKLARNSGEIKSINANVVYEHDEFEYWVDSDGEHIKHRPNFKSDRGPFMAVYAMATTKDGGVYIEVLTADQIKAIESASRGSNTPWKGPFRDEMIKKSAIKRLYKRLPSSTDLESAIEADNSFFDLNQVNNNPEPRAVNEPLNVEKLVDSVDDDEEKVEL